MEIYTYKSQTGNKIMWEDFVTEYFMQRCTLRKNFLRNRRTWVAVNLVAVVWCTGFTLSHYYKVGHALSISYIATYVTSRNWHFDICTWTKHLDLCMKQLDLFRSSARAINPSGNKPDSVTSSADWGNEVCGIYFLSLGSTRGGKI